MILYMYFYSNERKKTKQVYGYTVDKVQISFDSLINVLKFLWLFDKLTQIQWFMNLLLWRMSRCPGEIDQSGRRLMALTQIVHLIDDVFQVHLIAQFGKW